MEKKFEIVSNHKPAGDQPKAIESLVEGINAGCDAQTLLGITGSGKPLQLPMLLSVCKNLHLSLRIIKPLQRNCIMSFVNYFPIMQ